MVITSAMIIEIGAVCGVLFGLMKIMGKLYDLIKHQDEQDEAIKEIKEELVIIIDGLHATLDGLEQQGCNHTVPATKEKIYNHLNQKSHK